MKKAFYILLIVLSFFLVSCERGYKVRNVSKKIDGNMVYKSPTGNWYFYRQATIIKMKKDRAPINYKTTSSDKINEWLKKIPTRNYKKKTEEEFKRALMIEDENDIYYFGLNYGIKNDEIYESVNYYICPTKIFLYYKNSEEEVFYMLKIDEDTYLEFYKMEDEYKIVH